MRKYFFSVAAVVTIFSLLVSFTAPTVFAYHNIPAGQGDCKADVVGFGNGDEHCAAGLKCIGNDENNTTGTCTQLAPELFCKCEEEGNASSGHNGFRCGTNPDAPDGPIVYCSRDVEACIKSTDTPVGSDFKEGDQTTQPYLNNRLKGVRCSETIQKIANCTCQTPDTVGEGKNGFVCVVEGTTLPLPTNYCATRDIACHPEPGRAVSSTAVRDPIPAGVVFQGVDCSHITTEQLNLPPLPPVPPPPCAPGKLIDSICTAFLTGFGEIGTDAGSFLTRLFGILLAASGAIAVFLFIRAGYMIMTSAGKPEKVQAGRDQFVAAVVGLLFMIFSFIILEVIGVDILRLPDFNSEVIGPGTNPGAPAPDHCNSCETAAACQARGGTSRGVLDCGNGSICCE